MNIKEFIISSLVLLTIDFVYLFFVGSHYGKMINNIQKEKMEINYIGILIAYTFLVLAINNLILEKNESLLKAFILGLSIYGVYEGTNLAIIKNWKYWAVISDTLWGGILFVLTAFITKNLKKMKLFL